MHSHDLFLDLAYRVIPVAGNSAARLPRTAPRDAIDTDITLGPTFFGTCGEPIGSTAEVYFDNQPGWAMVSTVLTISGDIANGYRVQARPSNRDLRTIIEAGRW